MSDPIALLLTMVMIGQITVSVPVLISKAGRNATTLPLAVFLFACGMLALNSLVLSLFPQWYVLYTALAFPVLFVLCPSLWFYVQGLTANTSWQLNKQQAWHYVLVLPAIVVSAMILALPKEAHSAIFVNDTNVSGTLASVLLASMLIMMLLWLVQCVYTLIKIIRQLSDYRKRLKDVFSNNEDKELHWINWLLFIALCTWLLSLVAVFSSSLFDQLLFSSNTELLLSLLLLWSLTHFGLQQQPILANYQEMAQQQTGCDTSMPMQAESKIEQLQLDNASYSPVQKYQRSALDKTQSRRIADKINAIMTEEQLYLDSNLSLQKLASHLKISPNYVSQTLNETLSVNFFDFVNRWRIQAAKPKILASEGTILDIALEVGFNARSSFYKAFKQETGQTPSEFRKNTTKDDSLVKERA